MRMAGDVNAYMVEEGLDADVLFTGSEGPIAPNLREAWVEDHENAVSHPRIEFNNETGEYTFAFEVPEETASRYQQNKQEVLDVYAGNPHIDMEFTDEGVVITGCVQNPGTACLLAKMVEKGPRLSSD